VGEHVIVDSLAVEAHDAVGEEDAAFLAELSSKLAKQIEFHEIKC
jgi:hypothetical protein